MSPELRRLALGSLVVGISVLSLSCRGSREQPVQVSRSNPHLPLVHDGDAVFFVGNSFFGWEDRPLPEWVAAIGRTMSPPVRIEVGSDIVFGNTPLAGFLGHPATQKALASRKYKVFVLQGEEMEPVDHKHAFHQAVRDFNRAIIAAGGRTVLFMTWEFRWRRFIRELAASYEEIAQELGIPVIPAGLIYEDAEREPVGPYGAFWLTSGDLHQNAQGSAVNAYATFAFLTGLDPRNKPFVARNNTNDPATMRHLADLAWARVQPLLLPENPKPPARQAP